MPTPGSGDPRDGLKMQVPRKGRHAVVSGAQGAPGRAGAVPAQEVGPPAREAGTGHVPCPGLGPCSGQGRSASEGTSARHSPMSSPALPTPWGRPLRTPALVLLWTVQCGVVWGLLSVPHVPGSLDSFPSRKTWLRAPGLCQGHSWRQARVQFCPLRQGWEVGAVGWGASGRSSASGDRGGWGQERTECGGQSGRPSTGLLPGARGRPLSGLAKEPPRQPPPTRPAPCPRARLGGGETRQEGPGGSRMVCGVRGVRGVRAALVSQPSPAARLREEQPCGVRGRGREEGGPAPGGREARFPRGRRHRSGDHFLVRGQEAEKPHVCMADGGPRLCPAAVLASVPPGALAGDWGTRCPGGDAGDSGPQACLCGAGIRSQSRGVGDGGPGGWRAAE